MSKIKKKYVIALNKYYEKLLKKENRDGKTNNNKHTDK